MVRFCLHGEIRVKKSVASPSRPQKTVRTWREGKTESRSHPGTGCLPPWQTNPPIWRLVVSEDELGRGGQQGAQEGGEEYCVLVLTSKTNCIQVYITVIKGDFNEVLPRK